MTASVLLAQPPALINYQGRLVDGTNLVNGTVGVTMVLLDAPTGGNVLYACSNQVTVVDGLYHTHLGQNTLLGSLDQALAFPEVWLQIVVNGDVLLPRERLVSVPYARVVHGMTVGTNRSVTINPGLNPLNPLGGLANSATGYGSVVGGGHENLASGYESVVSGGYDNMATNSYTTISGGSGNRANSTGGAVAGGQGNIASGSIAVVGGGGLNQANGFASVVGGGALNRADGYSAVVGGGWVNRALGTNSVVAGGISNIAYAAHATVGGGIRNIASNEWSTVGGGSDNQASGDVATVGGGTVNKASATWAAVGGGAVNTASGLGSFVGGGYGNMATTLYATVAGGFQNTAGGAYAAVPGGYQNTARGSYSMAAGNRAKALHNGTFVWADSISADFSSTGTNQYLIRAGGGVGINTATPLAPLHVFGSDPDGQFSGQFMISGTTDSGVSNSGAGLRLAGNDGNGPREWGFIRALKSNSTVGNTQSHMSFGTRLQGGSLTERMRLDSTGLRVNGTFVSSSDREKKQDIVPADPQVILAQVAAMPVHYWRYRDDPDTLHVGPMAQDFHAAFGVGPDDRHIAAVDADGVALAAIQALAVENNRLERKVTIFGDQVSELKDENARLREELEAIKRKLGL